MTLDRETEERIEQPASEEAERETRLTPAQAVAQMKINVPVRGFAPSSAPALGGAHPTSLEVDASAEIRTGVRRISADCVTTASGGAARYATSATQSPSEASLAMPSGGQRALLGCPG